MKIELFEVVKKLMALHNVQAVEYNTPFHEDDVDCGLRKNFYPDFSWEKMVSIIADRFMESTLYIIQDFFEINYAVILTDNNHKGAIVVGPYRLTGDAFDENVYKLKGFGSSDIAIIKDYMLRMPHIHEDVITQQLAAVLSTAYPDKKLDIRHVKENVPKAEDYGRFSYVYKQQSVRSMDNVEYRYSIENEVLTAISNGNLTKARKAMKKLTGQDIAERYAQSVQSQKKSLIILNTLFRKAIEQAGVHPYYIDEISYRFFQKIDIISDRREQTKLLDEMLTGYCEYVKKYSSEQYSRIIRNAINYIHINLENKISLIDIASVLKISPNHLARKFHAETDKTIVEYINYTRVITAANKLRQTSLTIAEIAASVGIQDTNYFSRIFKKYMGCSPSEYRQ